MQPIRVWIFLFLLVSQSASYAATVLSQGVRNVKNGAAYGGASAVGDGMHDDTQAILDALNIGVVHPVSHLQIGNSHRHLYSSRHVSH